MQHSSAQRKNKKAKSSVKKALTSIQARSQKTIHSANEEILARLNYLAGRHPFSTSYKGRKYDPL